jgi:DNA-binding protein Fis
MSLPTGGVLFGIAYLIVSRTLPHRIVIREYLVISAFGFVLLFVSNQGITLVSAPYPPFGLPTISFFGVASYLILVGIYSSAISVSEDSTLRQMIRSLTTREPRLLDSIGTAHMEQEIQERVIALTKQNQERMAEETGIEPSLTDDEMKQYLEEVINEVRKQKSTTTKNTSNGSGLE